MTIRKTVGKGLAGLVLVGGSMGLGGCTAVGLVLAADHHAHVQGKYNVEAARIRAGGERNNFYNQKDFNGDGKIDAADFFLEGIAEVKARELNKKVKSAINQNENIYLVSEEITIKDSRGIRTYKRKDIKDIDNDGSITMKDLELYIDRTGVILKGKIVVGSK